MLMFVVAWLMAWSLYADIVVIDRLQDMRPYLEPGALVIFDLDNTLVHPHGRIGSDEWFVYMLQEQQQQGKTFDEALNYVLPVYCEVQYGVSLRPVESDIPDFIRSLQESGMHVIALTARTLPLVQRTIDQLAEVAIDFAAGCMIDAVMMRSVPNLYVYKRGILFSGQNRKGDVLIDFLTHYAYHPTSIVFVDDKMSNLTSVAQAAQQLQLPFTGIRYSALDDYVAAFNAQEAHEELIAFYHR